MIRTLGEVFGALGVCVLSYGAGYLGWTLAHPAVGAAAGIAVMGAYAYVQSRRLG